HPNLIIGLAPGDDAAVYLLNERQALVQTLDFFPPIVDDPYTYGAIAAANSISDVYAMGGEVTLALNIVGYPTDLDKSILTAILQGGGDKVREAGGVIGEGHTVTDAAPERACFAGLPVGWSTRLHRHNGLRAAGPRLRDGRGGRCLLPHPGGCRAVA